MSNAGYGNHDQDGPGSAAEAVEGRKTSPLASPEPGPGSGRDAKAPGRHPGTPGDGASSKGPQGDDVDPGAG